MTTIEMQTANNKIGYSIALIVRLRICSRVSV
jgi:hypothetical protein